MYNSDLLEIVPVACMYYNGYNLKLSQPPPAKMSYYELDIITAGRAHLVIDGAPYMLYPDDMCFRKPGQFNQHLFDTSYECLHFRFDVNITGTCDNFLKNVPTFISKSNNKDIKDAVHTFHKNYYNESEYSNIMCKAMLLVIKAGLFRQAVPLPAAPDNSVTYHIPIRKAIDHMHKSLATQTNIEELAEYCGYSMSQFQKIFKDATGVSPHQYLLKLKIDFAKNHLVTTNEEIKYIAQQCGFVDSNYFSIAFKRIVGITPSQFRKNNM